MRLLKAVLFVATLFALNNSFAQEGKGHCFREGAVVRDARSNSAIAYQLSQVKQLFIIGPKVTFAGRHIIFEGYSYKKNDYNRVIGRYRSVHAAFRHNKTGEYTIHAFLEYQDAHSFGWGDIRLLVNAGTYHRPLKVYHKGVKWRKDSTCIMNSKRAWAGSGSGSGSVGASISITSSDTPKDAKNGEIVDYNDDGTIYSKSYWNNGALDSSFRYHKDALELVRRYKNKKKHGAHEKYYAGGVLRELQEYFEGKKHGAYERYDKDGDLVEIGTFKNGQKDGTWRRPVIGKGGGYVSGNYVEGEKEGKWKWTLTNGEERWFEHYKAGKLHGPFQRKNEDGVVIEEGHYNEGEKDGDWKKCYNDLSQCETGTYNMGLKMGEWKIINKQGIVIELETRLNNRREGPYKEWDDSGNLTVQGQHKNSKRHGEWIYYNGNTGKKYKRRIYEKGIVIDEEKLE